MIDLERNWLRRFRRNLGVWYDAHARDLPWRRTSDPYRIWISEIMLQQTTVAAVTPYFHRFMKRFPTVRRLAAASEDEVLRSWEGLGYYSRARNLHKAARRIVDDFAGRFPSDAHLLATLPGIGRYTAGAIASFAFNRPAPIVEANTLRLYCRLLAYRDDPRSSAGQNILWELAEKLVPRQRPGRFNQALMELGATVCTPSEPRCPDCPVRSCCSAFQQGLQAEIPAAQRRPEITAVTEATLAICKQGDYLLIRRGDQERWAGLWDFPRFALAAANDARPSSLPDLAQPSERIMTELTQRLETTVGVRATLDELLTTIRHSVTRYRITLWCFQGTYQSGEANASLNESRWVSPADFADYPLSVTGRKLAKLLAHRASA